MRRRTSVVGDLSVRNRRIAERNCSCSSVNANWMRRLGSNFDSSGVLIALEGYSAAGFGIWFYCHESAGGGNRRVAKSPAFRRRRGIADKNTLDCTEFPGQLGKNPGQKSRKSPKLRGV